jgi:hypothetical protein
MADRTPGIHKFEYAPAPESRAIVDIKPSYGLFVNGEFVDGHGKAFKTISPSTEEVLAEIAGPDWLSPDWFRFGASTLLNDLLMQRTKLTTGVYSGPDYFTLD